MKKNAFPFLFFIIFVGFLFVSPLALGKQRPSTLPHWVSHLEIPQEGQLYLVVKGIYSDEKVADKTQKFIQQLIKKTPADGVDLSDHYKGLPKGRYVVGMLFDSEERARWWIQYSYRNQRLPKGRIRRVQVIGGSKLPYMPSASVEGTKRLFSEEEVLTQVKLLPDVQKVSQSKKLQFKFTDYPRNGDLRYEVEILEDRGAAAPPIMLDFVMVSAINGQVVERYSRALGQRSIAK